MPRLNNGRLLIAVGGALATFAAAGMVLFRAERRGRFTSEQVVPLDIDATFTFFADARNLEAITPPWLRFRVLTPGPIVMAAGTCIDYALRIRGVPTRWRSQITEWTPPHRFVDVQLRGPYRSWRHMHTFEADSASSTIVRDTVEYSVPGGSLVERLLVRPDIERIFAYRRSYLERWAADRLRDREMSGQSGASGGTASTNASDR